VALSNPTKLFYRVALLLYGLSGGTDETKQVAETKPQVERGQPEQLKAMQQQFQEFERMQKEMERESERLKEQLKVSRQALDELQHRASAKLIPPTAIIREPRLPRSPDQKGSRPIGGDKDWRIDEHGVIRDRLHHPVGTWGVEQGMQIRAR
jgi:hypothetical protein